MTALRNLAEPRGSCGTTISDAMQVIEIACGTICGTTRGTCGTIGAKALKNIAEPCGTSAEPHTPLKGSAAASAPRASLQGIGEIDEALWSDPKAYYDGPITADLSDLDPRDTAAFWQEALTTDRATLRTQWPRFKGKVPDGLAADLVSDIHGRGK